MMNPGDSVDFVLPDAGGMIWVGSLGAHGDFCRAWGEPADGKVPDRDWAALHNLILTRCVVMPLSLIQDDGFIVRVTLGELGLREREDWTARATWQLDLSDGKLMVSGVMESEEPVPSLADADPEESLQVYLSVPPGMYRVTVYAYPPGDLSSGWRQIERPAPGAESVETAESLVEYFSRTRAGEPLPDWFGREYAATKAERKRFKKDFHEKKYVHFVVQLVTAETEPPVPQRDEQGCLTWEFRKPDKFPLGVLALIEFERDDDE